jgi:hypothetical protein
MMMMVVVQVMVQVQVVVVVVVKGVCDGECVCVGGGINQGRLA